MHTLLLIAVVYLLVNFCCALLLHLHGLRQAHLPLRFLDILMHFVLLSALAIPILVVMSAEAFFGRDTKRHTGGYHAMPQHH